jgi:PEGA domain
MRRAVGACFATLLSLAPTSGFAQIYYPPPYWIAGPESDLRLAVTPREAMVYVDGYLAGTVDDFDGVFQRLHVAPGEHEITFYLQGYRTIRQRLYLSPNGGRKISATMEKLGAGEAMEPPPTPPVQAESDRTPQRDRPFPGGRRAPDGRDTPPRDAPAPRDVPAPPAASQPARGGSLVLRVQPGEADILIDGELSKGPSGDERLVVQVSEGHHRIEVKKDGYVTFSSEVDVKAGDSLPINVSLAREGR